jgi:hypothetical protein
MCPETGRVMGERGSGERERKEVRERTHLLDFKKQLRARHNTTINSQ